MQLVIQQPIPNFIRRSARAVRKAAIGTLVAAGLLVDVFAGFGGGSIASENAHGRPVDIAINHWATAIEIPSKTSGFIENPTGESGKISEPKRDANPDPALTTIGPVKEAQAMADSSLFASSSQVNSPAKCARCGKSLRSDNRSGYCRNHTPKPSQFAYGKCSGCRAQLGKDNSSGKCKFCKTQETGRINGGQLGALNPAWSGGRTIRKGYVFILNRTHPRANARGYVAEHLLVVEKAMGRALTDEECVHHVNERRDDNRPENLWVFANVGYHSAFHKWGSMKGLVWRGDGGAL